MLGDYEVLEQLGAGGMGCVYKVRHKLLRRVDAMKVLLPEVEGQPGVAERFLREIQLLADLDNLYIAKLYNASRINNQLLMFMEFIDGKPVSELLKTGPLPVADAVSYTMQVLLGLAYAHERNIVHRDIKPANMMLTTSGRIKLLDFGVAKDTLDTEANLTTTGTTLGSLHYMSPEQISSTGEDKRIDHRADLYSLGVSLYEMVTGLKPFRGESQVEVLYGHLHRPPVPPIAVNPVISAALSEIILKAMSKDPPERFQSAYEFCDSLQHLVLGDAPVVRVGDGSPPIGVRSPLPESGDISAAAAAAVPPADVDPLPSVSGVASPPAFWRAAWVALGCGCVLVAVIASVFLWSRRSGAVVAPGVRDSAKASMPLSHGAAVELSSLLLLPSGDMVLVAAGAALLGPDRHSIYVPSFYIDRTEVSNRAFADFCRASARPIPNSLTAHPDAPAVNVTFSEAAQFARWAGKRLPRAVEWEKAARGADGRPLPWGDALELNRANVAHPDAGPVSVVSNLEGASPYKVLNLIGNVWEWVDEPAKPEAEHIANLKRQLKHLKPPLRADEPYMEIRGGSYQDMIRPADLPTLVWDFGAFPARAAGPEIGFRCVKDVLEK